MLEGTLHNLRRYFTRILREDMPTVPGSIRAFHYLVRLVTHVVIELDEAQFLQRASALAYTSLLSLVPVTALFVLYFKMAGKLDTFSLKAQSWILETFVAESAQGVVDYLDKFVANLHTRTLGAFGAIGLMFTAYSLLRTVEKSLNDLWKVRRHRTIWARIQMLCAILIVVPTALIASLYFSGRVQEFKLFNDYRSLTTFVRASLVTIPFLLTAFSFAILFKVMPNTRVRWKTAFISALVSASLFESTKWGFNFYVLKIIPVHKIYGSLGLIPILLLWIYFVWVIVLFGVELGYTIQNLGTLQEEMREKNLDNPLALAVHEEWGLRIVEALARRFSHGEGPQTAQRLAKDVGLPVDSVEDHLGVLLHAQVLVTAVNNQQVSYLFSRPLERLTVADVTSAFRNQLTLAPRIDLHEEQNLLQLIS